MYQYGHAICYTHEAFLGCEVGLSHRKQNRCRTECIENNAEAVKLLEEVKQEHSEIMRKIRLLIQYVNEKSSVGST